MPLLLSSLSAAILRVWDRDISNTFTNDTRQILSQTQLTLFRGYILRIESIHHRALT